MKVFILEDSQHRIDFFKETMSKHKLFVAKDVEKAKDVFEKNKPFDLIMLDHDLGGRVFVNPREENTGYQFAKFLKNQNNKTLIVIHSSNVNAAALMKNILYNAYIIPITTLFDEWRWENKSIIDMIDWK